MPLGKSIDSHTMRSLILYILATNPRDAWIYKYYVIRCNIFKVTITLSIVYFLKRFLQVIFFFNLFISTNISFYFVLFYFCVWLIFFKGEPYSSNFYCSILYLSNIQLNFISFKFIIQNSHLFRNKEIIIIIKTHHKITMLSLLKLKWN